jgi:hypothetical protein
MAIPVRLISGVQREIWQEAVAQGGGVTEIVSTGIRISAGQLSRVQGFMTVGTPTGTPVFTAVPSMVNGRLVVTIVNTAAGGNSGTWTLDIRLVQSMSQVNGGTAGFISIANSAVASAIANPQTLAQTYDVGGSDTDQRMIVTTAKGGGVTVDCTDAGVTGDGVSLEIRQSSVHELPFALVRRGDIAGGPTMTFTKTRGTAAIPADVQVDDALGVCHYYARTNAAILPGARITAHVLNATIGALAVAFDFQVAAGNNVGQVLRLASQDLTGNLTMTCYGATPRIVPNTNQAGALGIDANRWGSAHINVVSVGIAVPTARVHIAASTAAAGTAPLKLAPGIVLAAPESGAIESTNTHIYWTNNAGVRLQLDNDAATTPNLANVYDAGNSAANQTMTLTNAHGGGILIDCTNAGVTADLVSLSVRQSVAHVTPVSFGRFGNDAVAPILPTCRITISSRTLTHMHNRAVCQCWRIASKPSASTRVGCPRHTISTSRALCTATCMLGGWIRWATAPTCN